MKIENHPYILDSFALLAQFQAEPDKPRVEAILRLAERQAAVVYMSVINLGEVGTIVERRRGMATVQEMMGIIDHMPITIVDADRRLTLLAAHIKALYPISYADAIAVALAQLKHGIVVTGDPEFRKVGELLTIEWILKT